MKRVKIKSWAKMIEEGHTENHTHNNSKELCLWDSKDEFSFTKTMEDNIPENRIIEINGNREWVVSQTGVFTIEEWMIEGVL